MNLASLENVPQLPGVYLWKDILGTIIYIGKAKKLKNRMSQYLKGTYNSYKTEKLVENIDSFEYFITETEKEALILERNLIEKHTPSFNILLMDDKRYPYIQISIKDKLLINIIYRVKSYRSYGSIIYGPFPNGYGAKKMANLLTRLAIYKNGLPNPTTDINFWKEQFLFVKRLLSSESTPLIKDLREKMMIAASNLQFEIAQDLKESIAALEFYQVNQNVELASFKNIDVIAFVETNDYISLSMLFYRQGNLLSKIDRVVEIVLSVEETIRQFLQQYYSFNFIPDEVWSNIESLDIEMVRIHVPQKGIKRKTVNIALANAEDNIQNKLNDFVRKEELTLGAVEALKQLLGLSKVDHIVMVDNSNTNNTDPVSAFVSYRNAIKQKKEYRKYNLQVNDRLADVDYMRQGVTRHFENGKNPIPDLLIVDGGKAQVNEVKKVLGDSVNIIGLVKDNRHVTKSMINLKGQEIQIENRNLLNFLKGIQEEVDRFAKFHHNTRRKTTLEGVLIQIPGVGIKIESKLLERFGNYSNIYNASVEELEKVVPKRIAIEIKEFLREY